MAQSALAQSYVTYTAPIPKPLPAYLYLVGVHINQNKTDGPLHKAEKSETGDAKSAVLRTSPVVKEPIKESPGVAP